MSISAPVIASKEQLIRIMQDPHYAATVGIPAYKAMVMLQEMNTPKAPPMPTHTVAEQVASQATAPQGIPSLPQQPPQQVSEAPVNQAPTQNMSEGGVAHLSLPDDMYDEKHYAGGGIVAFGGGGYMDPDKQYSLYQGLLDQENQNYEDTRTPLGFDWRTLSGRGLGERFIDWTKHAGATKGIKEAIKTPYDPAIDYYKSLPESNGIKGALDTLNKQKENWLNSTVNPTETMSQVGLNNPVTSSYMPATLDKKDENVKDPYPEPEKTVDTSGIDSLIKGVKAPTIKRGDYNFSTPDLSGDYDTLISDLGNKTVSGAKEDYRSALGTDEYTPFITQEILQRQAEREKLEKQSPWMALTKAGLTMASTTIDPVTKRRLSPLESFSKGALEGLKDYADSNKELRDLKKDEFSIKANMYKTNRDADIAATDKGWSAAQQAELEAKNAKLQKLNYANQYGQQQITNKIAGITLGQQDVSLGLKAHEASLADAALSLKGEELKNTINYQSKHLDILDKHYTSLGDASKLKYLTTKQAAIKDFMGSQVYNTFVGELNKEFKDKGGASNPEYRAKVQALINEHVMSALPELMNKSDSSNVLNASEL